MTMDEAEEYDNVTEAGFRQAKLYPLSDLELSMFVWSPWWIRRRMAKRIREETKFED